MDGISGQLLAALGLGFLGSTHCLSMCGGIASALGMGTEASSGWRRGLVLLGFNIGRIASYALIGLLLGSALQFGVAQLRELLLPLRLLAGGLLIAMGCYVAGWWMGLTRLEKLALPLWQRLQPLASRLMPVSTFHQALALGGLWGWLPCGLVYSTLAWSAASGSGWQAAMSMLVFGLGTMPAMLGLGLAGASLAKLRRAQWFRTMAGVLLIAFGVWTLVNAGPHRHAGQPDTSQLHQHH